MFEWIKPAGEAWIPNQAAALLVRTEARKASGTQPACIAYLSAAHRHGTIGSEDKDQNKRKSARQHHHPTTRFSFASFPIELLLMCSTFRGTSQQQRPQLSSNNCDSSCAHGRTVVRSVPPHRTAPAASQPAPHMKVSDLHLFQSHFGGYVHCNRAASSRTQCTAPHPKKLI